MCDNHLIPLSDGCTRRHALKVLSACFGGAVLGPWLPRGSAALPWGETPRATLLEPGGTPLTLGEEVAYGRGRRQACPTLVAEAGQRGRRLWTSWVALAGEREALFLRNFDTTTGTWGTPIELSDPTETTATDGELAVVGAHVLSVWLSRQGDAWQVRGRRVACDGDTSGDVALLHETPAGGVALYPGIATTAHGALIVWQEHDPASGQFVIRGRHLDLTGQPRGDVFDIARDGQRDCCHPAVVASPTDDTFAVAFDRQDAPGTQNVYVTFVTNGQVPDKPLPATDHPASDVAPALAFTADGEHLWVAWHSDRRGDGRDITPWYRLAALRRSDRTWSVPAAGTGQADRDSRRTVQGFELVRLAVSPAGVVCVLGRASHNFLVQYYSRAGRSALYRLPEDGWGGRGRLLRGAFDNAGGLWLARRDLGGNALTRIDGFNDLRGPIPMQPRVQPAAKARTANAGPYDWPPAPDQVADLQLYFGDLHGHSWQSDGMGDPETSYLRARDVYGDDFHVLTDHDYFVGQRVNDGQWQQQKDIVEHYHEPGRFITLFGQEWTTARVGRPHGWGHFNVYAADPRIPLFDHTDERWRDLPQLYAAIRPYDAIAIPHHIGWTGVPWATIEPALTPVVEICSVHGAFEYEGNEPIRHRGGMRGHFYRDGLARGLHVGVIGASDQHGLQWHHGICHKRNCFRAGLTGVWAPKLTRDALLDALRRRRTFATTGVKLWLYFVVNDALMGTIAPSANVAGLRNGPPRIRVQVAVPPSEGRLAWLEVVRNGAVVHRYGAEGQHSRYTFVDEAAPDGPLCYYLRVTLADGNMAWSSPVWS